MVELLKFKCPKCRYTVKAELKKYYDFILYRCPKCHRNVVYYDKKFDIISNDMVERLKANKRLKIVNRYAHAPIAKFDAITEDEVLDLKILLETEKDFDSFLSKI